MVQQQYIVMLHVPVMLQNGRAWKCSDFDVIRFHRIMLSPPGDQPVFQEYGVSCCNKAKGQIQTISGQQKLMSSICNRSSITAFKSFCKDCLLTPHKRRKNTLKSTNPIDKPIVLVNGGLETTLVSLLADTLKKEHRANTILHT